MNTKGLLAVSVRVGCEYEGFTCSVCVSGL